MEESRKANLQVGLLNSHVKNQRKAESDNAVYVVKQFTFQSQSLNEYVLNLSIVLRTRISLRRSAVSGFR